MPAGFVNAVDASCAIAPAPAPDASWSGCPNSPIYKPPAETVELINVNKKNLIRDGGAPDLAKKIYVPYIVGRSMSYHPDCILIANELNARGRTEFNIDKEMHYEFLLNAISPKKRWASWKKPPKQDDVKLVMEKYKYSHDKALEVIDLIGEEELIKLRKGKDTGGVQK